MTEALHPIQLAARLTGLSPYVIRIWEQRYHAVEPHRTPTNHRLYSPADLERLRLLREVTHAGHKISQVARLTDTQLRELVVASAARGEIPIPRAAEAVAATPADESVLTESLAAVQSLDGRALEDTLKRATVAMGVQGVLRRLIAPLAQALGEEWRNGMISAAQEHFATHAIRGFLASLTKPFGSGEGAPALVVATPAGQVHEMGALLVGAVAANLGWQVTALGASLPALEIVGVAQKKRARAVALSVVYPEDDASLPGELALLRDSLPSEVALLVGGRAMPAYREVLDRLGAILVQDLGQLGSVLDALRRPPKGGKR